MAQNRIDLHEVGGYKITCDVTQNGFELNFFHSSNIEGVTTPVNTDDFLELMGAGIFNDILSLDGGAQFLEELSSEAKPMLTRQIEPSEKMYQCIENIIKVKGDPTEYPKAMAVFIQRLLEEQPEIGLKIAILSKQVLQEHPDKQALLNTLKQCELGIARINIIGEMTTYAVLGVVGTKGEELLQSDPEMMRLLPLQMNFLHQLAQVSRKLSDKTQWAIQDPANRLQVLLAEWCSSIQATIDEILPMLKHQSGKWEALLPWFTALEDALKVTLDSAEDKVLHALATEDLSDRLEKIRQPKDVSKGESTLDTEHLEQIQELRAFITDQVSRSVVAAAGSFGNANQQQPPDASASAAAAHGMGKKS